MDRTDRTRDELIHELVSAECELQRAVVPDTLEVMIRQCVSDRALLMNAQGRWRRERDELVSALKRAGEAIHSEYCGRQHHEECLAVERVLAKVGDR